MAADIKVVRGAARVCFIADGPFIGNRYAVEIDFPGNSGWMNDAAFESLYAAITALRAERGPVGVRS